MLLVIMRQHVILRVSSFENSFLTLAQGVVKGLAHRAITLELEWIVVAFSPPLFLTRRGLRLLGGLEFEHLDARCESFHFGLHVLGDLFGRRCPSGKVADHRRNLGVGKLQRLHLLEEGVLLLFGHRHSVGECRSTTLSSAAVWNWWWWCWGSGVCGGGGDISGKGGGGGGWW